MDNKEDGESGVEVQLAPTWIPNNNRSRVTCQDKNTGSRGHDRANLNNTRNTAVNLPTQLANNESAGETELAINIHS